MLRLGLVAFFVGSLWSIGKRLGVEHNLVLVLGFHPELGALVASIELGWDVAWRALGGGVKLGLAGFASIFAVIEAFNCYAVLAVDLCFAIGLDLLVTGLASHLNDSSCSTVGQCFVNNTTMQIMTTFESLDA